MRFLSPRIAAFLIAAYLMVAIAGHARAQVDSNFPKDSFAPLPARVSDAPLPMGRPDRRSLAKQYGGSDDSEAAVERALAWIVSRQSDDGGWNFNHNRSRNPEPCPDPGTAEEARNAATALALLPLLGARCTHKQGPYRKQVYAGLAYLIKSLKVEADAKQANLHEPRGSMYAHAYGALAICEAYAATHDKEMLAPAQLLMNYTVAAQDPVGGGWRYMPGQAGDVCVSTTQLLALRSGHYAYLKIAPEATKKASKFLDSVQANDGARYGYTTPGQRPGTTAMGLLCRMHLGWKRDNPALVDGVEYLDKVGPSEGDIYFDYYATQVMFQYGGEPWKRWNDRMLDMLLQSQARDDGVKEGSWYFPKGDHGAATGGRLYCTSLAALILETYYRVPQLYRDAE